MTTKTSEPLPILAICYDATNGGWKKFKADALLAHRSGYDLVSVTAIGQQSFGAVWKLVRPDAKQYADFFGLEDGNDYPLV